jgi:Phage integrase, N-terminal SAM-like domain
MGNSLPAGSDCTPGVLRSQGAQPKLLDRLRQALEAHRFGADTVARWVEWNRRFIVFHGLRHPETMGEAELAQFVTGLVGQGYGSARQLEAKRAVGFLYREVLGMRVGAEAGNPRGSPSLTPRLEAPVEVGHAATGKGAALSNGKPRLLEQMRAVLRARHYSPRTEECYVQWSRRFILFHHKRHPLELGGAHVEEFLTHLAVREHVSISTQNQALMALLFLYQQVLSVELPLIKATRSQRPRRLPVVLSKGEVRRVLAAVDGYEGLYQSAGAVASRQGQLAVGSCSR